jgi:hypothetical protein
MAEEDREVKVDQTGDRKNNGRKKGPLELAIESSGGTPSRTARFTSAITPDFLERIIVGGITGAPPPTMPSVEETGRQGLSRDIYEMGLGGLGLGRDLLNVAGQTFNYLGSRDPSQSANWGDYAFGAAAPTQLTDAQSAYGPSGDPNSPANLALINRANQINRGGQTGEEVTPTDWLAEAEAYQNRFAPDYSGIAQGWMDEGNLVNQRLQAMYDQIASRAGENVERIGDIYGGATAGIGETYDRSVADVADAYSSAQQQAAEQRARLGIEEAAPLTSDPMSRSQAESQALLEAGRAAGLGATERYGASSGDFASQMAQVAQQEGAQYQTGVADALRRQLMNLEMQEQQDAYQRAMQAPGLANDLFQASQLGQPEELSFDQELALEEFAYRRGKDAAEMAARSAGNQMDYFTKRMDQRADPDVIYAEIEELIQRGLLF